MSLYDSIGKKPYKINAVITSLFVRCIERICTGLREPCI